ncbi:ectoine/hydroxyectoine ABC transporter substrate-binding protein EhuB [Actinocatenispora rupis]|uniref:ABC transporter substrate-binding protein n=1 Tax=Actinocatenispora rupis TaxID=519421 RepID=A0A8J3NFY5_9ACTN|nr:ectoine/hydroxyectoine ABC transporter substrate-binding protein EhuB [Actinocatenispora rupis]GID14294.1 ABC transporter substrate-binding protein [Actinocatenispora rupis]
MTDNSQWSRRTFLRTAAVGGALAVPGVLAACSSTQPGTGSTKENTLDKIKKQGYITIGFAGEQPYGFKQGNDLVGEAPTLHKEIFTALGVKELRGVLTDFDALIPGLTANRFDVVSAGMAITPERCKQVIFSEPEFVGATALMVKKGNPKGLTDLKSAAAKKANIGVLTAAVEKQYATAAGVSSGSIKDFAKQQDGLDALVAGRIDAFALTDISLHWLAKINAGKPVEVTPSFKPELNGQPQSSAGGAVFRPTDKSLRDAFNKELKKITSDPAKYESLIGKYGFGKQNVPPASLTTAQLCKG